MELRHLRYFVAVAEELHFRRAAERLHMSQPPLSQQIRALETEVGVALLERDRRGVELTPAGQAFLDDTRTILAAVDRAVATARRVDAGEAGELAIGFVGSTMYGRVPEVLKAFRERHPDVAVHLRELTTSEQVVALQEQRIDIGFLRPPVAGAGLLIETLFEEPIVVALPHDHPLARRRRIAPRLLAGESIVALARSEAPGVYAAMEIALGRAGVVPRVAQVVTELQTAVGLVASGLGVTFVPESVRALERPEVVYRPLEGPVPTVGMALAYRAGPGAPVIERFLEVARAGARD